MYQTLLGRWAKLHWCSSLDMYKGFGFTSTMTMTAAFLLLGFLCWHGCLCSDPLTSRLRLTFSVIYPYRPDDFITTKDIATTPQGRLVLADQTSASGHPLRTTSMDQPGNMDVLPYTGPQNVHSIARLSTGEIAVTTLDRDSLGLVRLYEVSEESMRETRIIRIDRPRYCCFVVAPGPDPNTLLVAGYEETTLATFIDVVSVNGTVVDTLVEDMDFFVDYMSVSGDDVYLSGYSEDGSNLRRLDVRSKSFVPNIGALSLSSLGDHYEFLRGDFDRHGNFLVAADNYRGCHYRARLAQTCCNCVLVISPQGQTRILLANRDGTDQIKGVVATPGGFVVYRTLTAYRSMHQGLLEGYTLV